MGQLIAIKTKAVFQSMQENNNISSSPIYFILDTRQIYTHGVFINSASFGTASNGAVPLTIAGDTKQLALSDHTHSQYLLKDSDIDIGSHKITSGDNNELLKYSLSTLILGNTDSGITLKTSGSDISFTKGNTNATLLDTQNFSITNIPSSGVAQNNLAIFNYGGNSFTLNYIRRVNSSSTFDSLIGYTQAGTNYVNSLNYGFMTFYTDGSSNPTWSQLRINVSTNVLETRTSASTTWKQVGGTTKNMNIRGTNYAIYTEAATLPTLWAPAALGTGGQFLTVSDDGESLSWRNNPNSWRSILIKDSSNESLGTLGNATNSGDLTIKQGSNVTLTYSNNILTIASSYTNTWVANALDTAGYVAAPSSEDGNKVWKTDSSGNPGWREDSNSNTWRNIKINDETTNSLSNDISSGALILAGDGATSISFTDGKVVISSTNTWNAGSDQQAGYVPTATKGKFLHCNSTSGELEWIDDNNTWKAANTSQEGYAPRLQAASTDTIASQNTEYVLTYINGTETAPVWRKLPDNAFVNTWTQFVGATTDSNGTAGYLPAPGSTHREDFLRGDGTWQTLGSAAFTAADATTSLTRAEGNLTKDTWSDVGTFGSGVSNGTYVVSFTVDGTLYSGVFSYKSGDTQSEEINLHAAGTSTRRLYARTTGSKFQIVTDADTFSMAATTFNFRKLL